MNHQSNNAGHYLVIDLEATCSEDRTIPRAEMEIIEIGAVMVERRSLKPMAEFQSFVRPVRNRQLTEFCLALTSIRQQEVDTATVFPEVMQQLVGWMEDFSDPIFCSWGDYDRGQFQQDCLFHAVPYPFGEQHLNLKQEFARVQNCRRMGMAGALKAMGLPLAGTHHRGIDDARNIARLLPFIVVE